MKTITTSKSRTKNSTRNVTWNVANFAITTILSFVTRTFFVLYLGDTYAGLNGFFINIIAVLSLFEFGVGTAIIYALYKPIAENNLSKINALVRLFQKINLLVVLIMSAIGLAFMPLIPYLIAGEIPATTNIFLVHALFIFIAVIPFFFKHRRILFLVYQRDDIATKITFGQSLLLNTAKILIIVFAHSFLFVVVSMVVAIFLDNLVMYIISVKCYSDVTGKNVLPLEKSEKKWIVKYTGSMVVHKVGGIVVFGTDSILISALFGLVVLGHFSNYLLLFTSITSLIGVIFSATQGSVGNLIAQKTPKEAYEVYRRLNFMLALFVGFCFIAFFTLFQPFMEVWLGVDRQLTFITVALMCVSFYLTGLRRVNGIFLDCAGLLNKTMFNPIAEVPVKLGASIGLGIWLGLPGVILGTIISTLTTVFWLEPKILYKHYFKDEKVRNFFGLVAIYTLITAAIGAVVFFTVWWIPTGNISWFALKTAVTVFITAGLLILVYFRHPHFKYFIGLAKRILQRKKREEVVEEVIENTLVEASSESLSKEESFNKNNIAVVENDVAVDDSMMVE